MFAKMIKILKQVMCITIALAIICPSHIVALPKTVFEQALEAKADNKFKKALKLFKSISENDPDYGRALDEMASINEVQKSGRENRNTLYQAERLIDELDRGAAKCVTLFSEDGSPEVHDCVQEMSKVQNKVSEMLKNAQYEHPVLQDLNGQLIPFKRFDEVALPVTKVRPTREEIERASDKLMALETYLDDQNNPPNLVALGAFVLSQHYLGAARAHAKDCDVLRARGEGHSESARIICGFAEDSSTRYGNLLRRFEPRKLIDGPSIPALTFREISPITHENFPNPARLIESSLKIIPKANPTGPTGSDDAPQVIKKKKKQKAKIVVVEESASWMPYIIGGAVGGVSIMAAVIVLKMRGQNAAVIPLVAAGTALASEAPVGKVRDLIINWSRHRTSTGTELIKYAKTLGISVWKNEGDEMTFSAVAGNALKISVELAAEICQLIIAARKNRI